MVFSLLLYCAPVPPLSKKLPVHTVWVPLVILNIVPHGAHDSEIDQPNLFVEPLDTNLNVRHPEVAVILAGTVLPENVPISGAEVLAPL